MAFPALAPPITAVAASLNLSREQARVIQDCVRNYSTPDFEFFKVLGWIIFRITNAVMALFGMSDWQLAKDVIYEVAYQRAVQSGNISINPQNAREARVREDLIGLIQNAASECLRFCYLVHNEEITSMRQFLARYGDDYIASWEQLRIVLNSHGNGTL
jgi:hypothetical protein